VPLHAAGEASDATEALRQRACTELLRQAAQAAGLLAADDDRPRRRRDQRSGQRRHRALLERELTGCPSRLDEACGATTTRMRRTTAPASACVRATSCLP
jgi:peptidyl-prolyl cis-trans isomerase C